MKILRGACAALATGCSALAEPGRSIKLSVPGAGPQVWREAAPGAGGLDGPTTGAWATDSGGRAAEIAREPEGALIRSPMRATTVDELLERYDAFFIDAYGVLVSSKGALPGAVRFLERLEAASKKYLILTNDASRLPSTIVRRYARFGLELNEERILTSGLLLKDYFDRNGLAGSPTIVLGPEDSRRYIEHAGGHVVASDDESARVIAVCDDDGYDMRQTIDDVITTLFRRFDQHESTELVVPNPDLLYLRGERAYGITAGTMALILEAALDLRFPAERPRFERLGKPHAPMFEAAMTRIGGIERQNVVMLGDQLVTDIQGANDFGIDSVLLMTGISRVGTSGTLSATPTHTLAGLV